MILQIRISAVCGYAYYNAVSEKYPAVNGRQLLPRAKTVNEDNDTPVQPQPCKAGSRNGGGSVKLTAGVKNPWSKYAACRLIDSRLPGESGTNTEKS